MQPKICIVGSSNYDLIAYTKRFPQLGETIVGTNFKMGFGGKGANQAVAAAKLGANVTIVTKLGNDVFGKQTIENYKNYKINTDYISITDKAPSGVAPIWVDASGHNSIIVVPGANNLMKVSEMEHAHSAIHSSKILLCQNEIPFSVTKRALKMAKKEGVTTFFNPAPAPTHKLSESFFKLVDILCLNETELELLTKNSVLHLEHILHAGKLVLKMGVQKLIVTLGAKGCVLMTKDSSEHIQGYKVKAIDTTGAGDCFIGSFAYFYAQGFNEHESIQKAQYVASKSVQKHGTQISYPNKSELPQELFRK